MCVDTKRPPSLRPVAGGCLPTVGGFCALIIAMGIGRFAYTALLPDMMTAKGIDEESAGIMAAWNYAGYLTGMLAVRSEKPGQRRYTLLVLSLVLSIATTLAMGVTDTLRILHILRGVSGIASGACFVLCSAIVLDTLTAINRPVLAGLLYSGVGAGIALGGLLAGGLRVFGPDRTWLVMGVFCLPLAVVACLALRPGVNQALPVPMPGPTPDPGNGQASNTHRQRGYGLLLVCYFLEGFGYIIGTTFLVALVQHATGSATLAQTTWIVTGAAAALTPMMWRTAARKRGFAPVLLAAYLVQALGVALPALFPTGLAALTGGLLLGGTFMGISVLSLQYGLLLSGRSSAHTVAVMTAVYGIGQIIGPFIAGLTANANGFGPAFLLSGISLLAGAALFAYGLRTRNF